MRGLIDNSRCNEVLCDLFDFLRINGMGLVRLVDAARGQVKLHKLCKGVIQEGCEGNTEKDYFPPY